MTTVPDWLYGPPSLEKKRAPIVQRAQGLPFAELRWPDFERLVLRIVAAEKDILDCRMFGLPGEAQHGIDLLACSLADPQRAVSFQCKKVASFKAKDIQAAVKKFEDGPWAAQCHEFVLCVSSSLESTTLTNAITKERKRLAGVGITFRIWDGALAGELNVRLKQHPQIVDDFFGREWVREFNGDEAAVALGQKLDGFDFTALRARLTELYRVIFTQHDPGIRLGEYDSSEYTRRYVPLDVVESASLEEKQDSSGDSEESSSAEMAVNSERGKSKIETVGKVSLRREAWEWLRDRESCVILGEPGHGKSTLLRQIALLINDHQYLAKAPLNKEHVQRLPVWISFARFAAAIAKDASTSVDDFVCSWLHQFSYGDVIPLFKRSLRNSEFLLLVDGLDEGAMASEGREALDRIVTFAKSHRAIVICTSRPRSFGFLAVPTSWPVATLAPLSDGQIKQLATQWFAVVENTSGDTSYETRVMRAKPRGEAFSVAIGSSSRTLELARNPLLCQALVELFRLSHRLPEARVRAYGEIIDLFLRRHPQARAHAGFSEPPKALEDLRDSDLQDLLGKIAFDTQSLATGGIASRERCIELCAQYLEDDFNGLGLPRPKAIRRAPDVIELFISHFGILIERSPGELSFVHLSLQEFLAARAVTAMSEGQQLEWLRAIALNEQWRECIASWFGIQGEGGRRPLAASASRVLAELGQAGEWERLQILSIRTELATTDLGLPVSEARSVVAEAILEVEKSPFSNLRSRLASSITIGALGGAVREECIAAVSRWMPARSYSRRARLLQALGEWQMAADLAESLKRALHDEKIECRRIAAESLAKVFAGSDEVRDFLETLATTDLRPEVRAAALHSLAQNSAWRPIALGVTVFNARMKTPEMVFTSIAVRVKMACHTREDLNNLLFLHSTDALHYSLRDELVSLVCEGWPQDEGLRAKYIDFLRQERGTSGLALPLEYLLSSYQFDDGVAEIIARLFRYYGMHMGLDHDHIWKLLTKGYARNPVVVASIRDALKEYKEKYSSIMWHPSKVFAFLVLGDESARDELIDAYEDADLDGRYWIASTLLKGWATDPIVLSKIRHWADGDVAFAAPLAQFWEYTKYSEVEVLDWLEHLVREADDRILLKPVIALMDKYPNEKTRLLVSDRLDRSGKLWYYSRISIEARFAAVFPGCERSRLIIERALQESDGPSIGVAASGYQHDINLRSRLLAAACSAPIDVRLGIATVLKNRGGSPEQIEQLTPEVLAEATSSVLATALIARARACRHDADRAASLIALLTTEVKSLGVEMDRRRRTAIAALLEMGEVERVARIFSEDKSDLPSRWSDFREPDIVSLSVILDHWEALQSAAAAAGHSLKLPLAELLDGGYSGLIERIPALRGQLNERLRKSSSDWHNAQRFELLARVQPSSFALRSELMAAIYVQPGLLPSRSHACLVVRLLGEHFGDDLSVLESLIPSDPFDHLTSGEPGVLGHIVRSWPTSNFALIVKGIDSKQRSSWSALDRLLCACAWGIWDEAASAAAEIITYRYRHNYIPTEDVEGLRVWARSAGSHHTLVKWRASSDGDEAMTALLLLGERISEQSDEWLKSSFNDVISDKSKIAADGYDPSLGRVVSWVEKAYELLFR